MVFLWQLTAQAPPPAAPATLTGEQVRALYDVLAQLARGAANVRDGEQMTDTAISTALAPGVTALAISAAQTLTQLLVERGHRA